MHIQHFSVITLFQHYFPADGERSFGEGWKESWGEDEERVGEELLRGRGRWVERYRVESYEVESDRVESGTNKKESFEDFSSKLSHIKEGGDLLSRIALQYHRRRRA